MRYFSGFMAVVASSLAASAAAAIPRLNLSLSTTERSHAFTNDDPLGFGAGLWFADTHDVGPAEMAYGILANERLDALIFSFEVENQSGTVQTYTLDASLAVGPWTGPTYVGGSVAGLVTDSNLDGSAILASTGATPLMRGFVDQQSVFSLGDGPFDAEASFLGGTAVLAPQSAGLPDLDSIYSGDGILSDLAVQLTFTLSPGDTATLAGSFVVRTIPAPGAVMLGLAAGLPRRRRGNA